MPGNEKGDSSQRLYRWLGRTPVQTFILCPLAVVAFELIWRGNTSVLAIDFHASLFLIARFLGLLLMGWGYAQYHLVGRYRHPRAGGSAGMDVAPERILDEGPYRFTRNPMYLGHLIFLLGLAIAAWSWFGLILLVGRAIWFHRRVLRDEERLEELFGPDYVAYKSHVKRWIPGILV